MAFGAYDARFGASPNLVRQVLSTGVDTGVAALIARYSGGLAPQLVAVNYAEPVITLTSADIAGYLGYGSVSAGNSYTGTTITIPFQNRVNGGTFAGSSAHNTLSSTEGLLVPTEFMADQDAEDGATVTLEWHPTWDESTNPVVVNQGASLSAQAFNVVHTLGPVAIAGTAVDGVKSVRIRPGIKLQKVRYAGAPFCTEIFIVELAPEMEITFEDIDSVYDNSGLFKSINSSTAVAYFRKLSDGGTRVANATTEHLSFTLSNGLSVSENINVSGRDNGSASIKVYGKSLAFSAATAIS